MTPLEFALTLLGISVVAGFFGSLVGLGGGIVVVPVLTLLYHIDIRYAIGASIVSVIATSSGAAAAYVRERLTNLRVAMLLELGTTTGAITGAFLAGILPLPLVLPDLRSGAGRFRGRHDLPDPAVPPAPRSRTGGPTGSSCTAATSIPPAGPQIAYRVARTPWVWPSCTWRASSAGCWGSAPAS